MIAVMAFPLVMAIVLHEVAHGYVAYMKGDSTARDMGRLTLNPLAHVDLFGTVLMPLIFFYSTGMLFAFAKPVPVNFMNLHRPKEDMVWVAAAGPAMNLFLATVSAIGLHLIFFIAPETKEYIGYINSKLIPTDYSVVFFPLTGILYFSVILNVVLAVINLIPIPPADGGRIVTGLLPPRQAAVYSQIEPFGLLILMGIILFNPLGITHKVIWPLIISIVELLV
jgi:Zn-dependent protease